MTTIEVISWLIGSIALSFIVFPAVVYTIVKLATLGFYAGRDQFQRTQRRDRKGMNNGHSQG